MKRFNSILKLTVLTCFACLLLFGCAQVPKKPAPKPAAQEPTISLYDHKTGEKKKIKMEEYIAGVVAAEMEPTWPINALAAQAILARTFTMKNIETGKIRKIHGTDASTSIEEFQAYDPARINDRVRKAVQMTRGEVITYRGKYTNAWFNACCGGITASAKEGLSFTQEPTPYIKAGVKDNCLSITTPENRHWQAAVPMSGVRAAVQKVTGKNPGSITEALISEKGPSGRAVSIKLGNSIVNGPAFRNAVGSETVRSMLLSNISISGNSLVFTGKGFGHGVGMCQWGANLMAGQGKSPEDIINFYYRDVDLKKMWK